MPRRGLALRSALVGAATLVGASGAAFSWSLGREVAALEARVASLRMAIQTAHASPSSAFDAHGIVERIEDSVVTISAGGNIGSGFAFGRDGDHTLIVTNHHVIARPGGRPHGVVTVEQAGSRWPGHVVTFDPEEDLALIAVPVDLPTLPSAYSMSHVPRIGDPILVYGSPAGLEGTASVGIVSAVRGDWIQTDAQINPGSSGGPIVNLHGEVLGVTSLGFVGSGSGFGFARDIRRVCILDPSLLCG